MVSSVDHIHTAKTVSVARLTEARPTETTGLQNSCLESWQADSKALLPTISSLAKVPFRDIEPQWGLSL